MPEILTLKNVKRVVSKGREYFYYRPTMERLPDDATERARAVLALEAAGVRGRKRAGRGTWADLIERYRQSPEFAELAAYTRRDYGRHMRAIEEAWGGLQVSGTSRKGCRAMRDKLASTPRKANYRVAVLSVLLGFGREADSDLFGETNPAEGFKKLKQGPGYRAWPESVRTNFFAAASRELNWICRTMLDTGLRAIDARTLPATARESKGLRVRLSKTDQEVFIPYSAEMRRMLAAMDEAMPGKRLLLFLDERGRPWDEHRLRHAIARTLSTCGHKGYSAHGLRVTAGERLFEAGCDPEDVQAILGHQLYQMTRHYLRNANRARRAVSIAEARAAAGRKRNEN